MLNILLSGCNGHMGQSIVGICSELDDVQIVAGINRTAKCLNDFSVYSSCEEFSGAADVIIDFSNPNNLDMLLKFIADKKFPAVLCTTGYCDEQFKSILSASAAAPIFMSGNMSLGINLMLSLVKKSAAVLGSTFDIEIIEKHHNRKIDAPSGTANMIANAAAEALETKPEYTYERSSKRCKRAKNEIGISSVRGGNIVGEHEIIFAGQNEVLSIKHSAMSRDVFANGAISAARYMAKITSPGLYSMDDLLKSALGE